MSRHTYETTLSFGHDGEADYVEIDVTVSYAVSFGCPAQTYGPAERCYPAEDPEVTDITLLKVGDRFRPWRLNDWSDSHFEQLVRERLEDETHLLAMIEAASEDEAGVEEVIAERRWAERREEALV